MRELLGLPVEASEHAAKLDQLTGLVHWLMLVLFVGWSVFFLYTLFRFRARRNPRADYVGVKSHASNYVEAAVAIVEVVLLVGFSIPLWASRAQPEGFPPAKESVVVRVQAEQFAWNILYPGADGQFGRQDIKLVSSDNPMGLDRNDPAGKDDIFTINQLYLPVNKPVIVYLTSKDVIHSFALQQMRVKQDAIPGSVFPLWFVPTKTTAQIQEEMARTVPTTTTFPVPHVFMQDYSHDEAVLARKGSPASREAMARLAAAGITHALVAPMTPTEIVCAQLCGLGHYRMRGYYHVVTEAEFEQWLQTQAAAAAGGGDSGYE